MKIGLDIGSTTIKCVVLDETDSIIYKAYERHYSHIVEKAAEVLARLDKEICKGEKALLSISGSAGMGLATACGAALVLSCLERGLYPSWDAHTSISLHLAEKLGYVSAGPYLVYVKV